MMIGEHAAAYGAWAALVSLSTKIALLTELAAVKDMDGCWMTIGCSAWIHATVRTS